MFERTSFMAIASPFAETDAVASLPPLQDHFMVRRGKCGKEYRYEPSDVFR